LRRTLLAVAVFALACTSGLLCYRVAHPPIAPTIERAIGRALGLPPSEVAVAAAALRPPATLRLYGVRVGPASATTLDLDADLWAALRGERRLAAVRAEGLGFAGLGRAASVEAHLGLGARRVVVRRAEAIARLPLGAEVPVGAEEIGLELDGASLRRAAFAGGHVGALEGLSGSVLGESADGRLAVRFARPGLTVTGQILDGKAALEAELERLPLSAFDGRPVGADLTRASASGTLSLGRDAAGVRLSGTLAVDELALDQPALASGRIEHLAPTLSGRIRWSGEDWTGEGLRLQVGPVTLTADGRAEARHWQGTVTLARVGCAELLRTIGPARLPPLEGLTLEGTLGGRIAVGADREQLDDLSLDVDLDVGCRVLADAPLGDPHVVDRAGSLALRATDARGVARAFVLGPENPSWRPLSSLPPRLVDAFVEAEDSRFFHHHGFDLERIRHALAADLGAGGFSRGASTITQQVAKNLFLSRERTLGRKLEEAVLAWRMEQVLDKLRILELYLNLAELGPGVYGVAEGAERYFGKEPDQLDADEAAQLAALLPAPRRGMDRAWDRRYRALAARLPAPTRR
jgi:hypothetical protein